MITPLADFKKDYRTYQWPYDNRRSLNKDLESFYNNLQNQRRKIKKERVDNFLAQKLTAEEDLFDKRNDDYVKSLWRYVPYDDGYEGPGIKGLVGFHLRWSKH